MSQEASQLSPSTERDRRTETALGLRLPEPARLCYMLAPVALLTSAFLHFVGHHGYPLFSPEILLALLTLILIGAGIGAILAVRPKTLGHFLLIACVVAFFDLVAQDFSIINLFSNENTEKIGTAWHWGIVLFLFGLAISLHRHFSVIVTISAAAFAVCAVMLAGQGTGKVYTRQNQAPVELSNPPIIHLIFDEFIGVEGIPTDIPGGEALKEEIKAFYVEHGFNLYGAAFSHAASTAISLAALLNGQEYPSRETGFGQVRGVRRLKQNAWFEKLADAGYAIRVFDNSWMSYCDESNLAIVSCETSPANSVKSLTRANADSAGKAKVLLSAFLEGSPAISLFRSFIGLPLYRIGALDAPEILQSITESIVTNPTGTAFFAHLLSPHNSYVFDETCRPKRDVTNWLRRMEDFVVSPTTINSPSSRQERYEAYFAQVRCTQRLLGQFFDQLREAGVFQRATIIVHGDHGSRIGLLEPNTQARYLLTKRDLLDHYSTLFAVKRPQEEPGYDKATRSIQAIFAETFFGRNLTNRSGHVILRLKDGEVATWLPIGELGS